ncbi:restriction endonuclease fold toxin-2 domain-containing protein [Streptomyces sp. NBRC 110611]|uniref:restriction endonuclease fold toxin-2 domain-containing protein n=1 Tax=Streptomyces sp. NBRC 110611 TaxID=1621259 RepID=UPI00215C5937|nr:restriction endonuclease fold toxin-2 domain-containing protein [Streptomyces sp. NBRC 110611]
MRLLVPVGSMPAGTAKREPMPHPGTNSHIRLDQHHDHTSAVTATIEGTSIHATRGQRPSRPGASLRCPVPNPCPSASDHCAVERMPVAVLPTGGATLSGFEFNTGQMIQASMTMMDVMRGVRDTAIALASELDQQHGMAGDDDAGRAFAAVYKPAAAATLDKIGFGSDLMGGTGRGIMQTAREYMSTESQVSAELLGKQEDLSANLGNPAADCSARFIGLGRELPEVVGDTAWYDQYMPGGGDRYRGSAQKARDVSGSWRHAGKLLERLYQDAQICASTTRQHHVGEAADAFQDYFKRNIGTSHAPTQAQADEPLMANLVAACRQLANACENYADHIETALSAIDAHKADVFRLDLPWEQPMFGGNGFDGGLHEAVLGDPRIRQLGDIAHSLDSSQARIRLPGGDTAPRPPLMPGGGVRVPVPIMLASATPTMVLMGQRIDPGLPHSDPIPPTHPNLLSPAEQAAFRTWRNSLPAEGFAGGGNATKPENAYQMRVAGYPEREVPLPPGAIGPSGKGLMVDGLRPADGYAVEAKYVRDPGCNNTYRRLSEVDKTLGTPVKLNPNGKPKFDPRRDAMYPSDAAELFRYRAAMSDPRNSQIKGLEIITNDKEGSAYWQSMMAMTGVQGTTRYEP